MKSDTIEKSDTPRRSRIRLFLKFAGLLVGISLIYWFASKSNITGIWEQLELISFNFIFLIIATFSAYLMVTIAWKLSFLKSHENISIPRLFLVRLVGESLAQINPTNVIAGDALKALLLKRKGVSYKNSVVSITISRFLVLLSSITLIVIGIYLFFDYLKFQGSRYSIMIIIGLLLILLILLIYMLRSGRGIFFLPLLFLQFLENRFQKQGRFSKIIEKLKEVDRELIEFYRTKKINFISAFSLSFLHWLMGAMEYYLILYFLGFQVTFLSCVAIEVGVMVFKAMGAFVPGQIGIEEYAIKMMLEMVNLPGSGLWITVSILRRARQLFWIGAGLIVFLFIMRGSKELQNGNIIYNS